MPSLTKEEWSRVLKGLFLVPVKKRGEDWKRAVAFLGAILEGKNELARRLSVEGVYYAVKCSLCGNQIRLDEDFVFRFREGVYNHYDCYSLYYEEDEA